MVRDLSYISEANFRCSSLQFVESSGTSIVVLVNHSASPLGCAFCHLPRNNTDLATH